MNHRTAHKTARRLSAATMFVLVVTSGGCSQDASVYPSEQSRPLSQVVTAAPLAADIDILATVLPLTFDALHWGMVRVTNEVTALHAHALTEDDRPVEIRAQQTREGLDVQVRVGYFGDRRQEQRLLEELPRQIEKWRQKQKRKGFAL